MLWSWFWVFSNCSFCIPCIFLKTNSFCCYRCHSHVPQHQVQNGHREPPNTTVHPVLHKVHPRTAFESSLQTRTQHCRPGHKSTVYLINFILTFHIYINFIILYTNFLCIIFKKFENKNSNFWYFFNIFEKFFKFQKNFWNFSKIFLYLPWFVIGKFHIFPKNL